MRESNESASVERYSTARGAAVVGVVVMLSLGLGCGCRVVSSTATLPSRTVRTVTGTGSRGATIDLDVLQQRLMRFADDYSSGLVVGIDSLPAPTNAAEAIDRLRLKLNCVGSVQTVAAGPNELMNLADMFLLVTLTRAFVQEQWPGAYGKSAGPMLEACRSGETNITDIASTVVIAEKLNELRGTITRWRQTHSDLRSALFTRALVLEVEISARQPQAKATSGSLFSLFRLDPLAGLDPVARELAQTRLLGERTMFLAHRKPTLLRWQAELFVLETAETPPLLEVRTNATQTVASLAGASKTLQQFPDLVRTGGQTLLNALPSQEPALTNVTAHLTSLVDAGTKMSDSLNTTLGTARGIQETAVAASARKAEKNGGAPSPGIEDYTATARQVEQMAQQLTELLRTLNETLAPTNVAQLSAQVTPVMQKATAGGRAVTDYIFLRALLLVAFTCAAVLITALVWLWIRRRTKGLNVMRDA